jgi:hypothetical protein
MSIAARGRELSSKGRWVVITGFRNLPVIKYSFLLRNNNRNINSNA